MLETKRLRLLPLTAPLLKLLAEDIPALENALGVSYRAEPVEGMFKNIVENQLAITENDPTNYVWHSFWLIIRKSDNVVVGSADFKDIPDDKGETEIGYGLGKEFEKNGYMSEAVRAMCEWALAQEGVKHITAETELDGYASQNILTRCGFKEFKRKETVWWRL